MCSLHLDTTEFERGFERAVKQVAAFGASLPTATHNGNPAPACPKVEYRDVPGYEGYRVGSDGTTWTRRAIGGNFNGCRWLSDDEWRQLSGWKTQHGYVQVTLANPRVPGKCHKRYVHELILLAFVGPRPKGCHVCHKNGHGRDNRLDNLYYGTSFDNAADKIRHGKQPRGESHGMAKLSVLDVQEICNLLDDIPDTEIATLFGISKQAVKDIGAGRRWSHVTGRSKACGRSYSFALKGHSDHFRNKHYPKPLRELLGKLIDDAGNRCSSCGQFASRLMAQHSDRTLELDHKDPDYGNWIENFHAICRKCNRLKNCFVSPDMVIGEWVESSPAILVERMDRMQMMLDNPGWSVPCP